MTLPVIQKPKPNGYITEDNVEYLDYQSLSNLINIERLRIDKLVGSGSSSTAGNSELIDMRIDADGVEYSTAGAAMRAQDRMIPNKAVVDGNYIKFYRTFSNGGQSFLFQIDGTSFLENDLDLENLALTAKDSGNGIILTLSDGKTEKSVKIPVVVDSSLDDISENPVQNKVVKQALDGLGNQITDLENDVLYLKEEGLNLENLSLAAEDNGRAIVLYMNDGKTEKSVEIPFVVDSSLDIASKNPVQNRVIAEQINYLSEEIQAIKEEGTGGNVGVSVRLTNQNGSSTLVVSYGNSASLMFTFTSTENDIPTGNANCKITVNSVQKVNMSIPQGLTSIDVAPYLTIGQNTVVVTCTDINGKSRSLAYDITVIQLALESTFNANVPYNSDIIFKYTPYGSVKKTIHFLVDGNEIRNVTTSLAGKQMTMTLPKMSHGAHRLEVYSGATLNETELISPSLVYDIIFLETGDTTPIIASAYEVKTLSQGEQASIPYIVYDPSRLSCDITLDIYTMDAGSEVIFASQSITVGRNLNYWNTRKYPIGTVYFRIKYGDITKIHKVEVTENDLNIEAETNDLELWLSSEGRSNNETDPSKWSYKDITTTFTNVNWDSVGWATDEEGDVITLWGWNIQE